MADNVVGFKGNRRGPTPQDLESFADFFTIMAKRARSGEFASAVVIVVDTDDASEWDGYAVPGNHKLLLVGALERAKIGILDAVPAPVWSEGDDINV